MFIVIGCMLSGIGAGILLSKSGFSFGWLDRLVQYIIWLLLFLLGVEIGGDDQIISSLPTLGATALIIAAAATVGSCFAAALLAKWIGLKYTPHADGEGKTPSIWIPLKGSMVILAFFAAGVILGVSGLTEISPLPEQIPFYTLCFLILCVGITIGQNDKVFTSIGKYGRKVLLLPAFTIIGTLAGAAAVALLLPYRVQDVLAIGSGQAYYSLSSILIAENRGIELGTIALLANVIREIIALVAAPFLPRIAGPLSPIAAGGATTADTTLPIIRQVCGDDLAIVSVYHGFLVDFSVPFMVGLFCSL